MQVVLKVDNEEFMLECLSILGNLTLADLDYELILKEFNLVQWIKNKLLPGEHCIKSVTDSKSRM